MSCVVLNNKVLILTKPFLKNFVIKLSLLCIAILISISCGSSIKIKDNSYKEKYTTTDSTRGYVSIEKSNFCTISISYPSIYGVNNRKVQNIINNQLKDEFIVDADNYCLEDAWINVEKTFTSYSSDKLCSIMSYVNISSDITSGEVVKAYNIDIETGTFLTLKDLFNLKYKKEIVNIVLNEVFSLDSDKNNKESYKYYSSIKEDLFYRFQVQVLERTIIFMFKGDANVEPIYKAEIPVKRIKEYSNNKYI